VTGRNPVIELAEKIETLICQHPDPEEAEAACALARELFSLKAKRWLRPRIDGRVKHSLQEQFPGNRDAADGNPALSDKAVYSGD